MKILGKLFVIPSAVV